MGVKEVHEGCIVRDNNDPQKRGRLIVECPTIVTGESLGDWMEPTFHFVDSVNSCGSFFIPSVGSIVSVEVESGSEAQVNGLMPKWRCDVYPTDTIPTEFLENYPERRGWKTRSGHVMFFDDTDGEHVFQYTHPTGNEIYVEDDGTVTIHTTAASSIRFGSFAADEQAVLGNAFSTDLDVLVTALKTFVDAPAVQGIPGLLLLCQTLSNACQAFKVILAAKTDLSDKVVLEK
jgi:hypothetical protein